MERRYEVLRTISLHFTGKMMMLIVIMKLSHHLTHISSCRGQFGRKRKKKKKKKTLI